MSYGKFAQNAAQPIFAQNKCKKIAVDNRSPKMWAIFESLKVMPQSM
jgi:hypothetical protein